MAEPIYVTVSIDTEVDHDPNWVRSDPLAFDSLTVGVPERLQPVFEAVGAVPTYLLTVEVLEHEPSVEALRGIDAEHELGTHLHAAFVEPQKKFHDYAGIDSPDFQACLPPQIELAKLATLTDLFESRFGYRPTSFRAGRYGAGPNTIDALESLGYRVDTSVTPRMRWREPAGSVDFRRAPLQPYRPAPGSIARAGVPVGEGGGRPRRLLEVPVTVRPRPWRRTPAWFRPWASDVEDMKATARWHIDRARGEPVCLNMMFHSMEIIEAASPYPQDAAGVARFLDDLHATLEFCRELGARFVPLSALDELWP